MTRARGQHRARRAYFWRDVAATVLSAFGLAAGALTAGTVLGWVLIAVGAVSLAAGLAVLAGRAGRR